MQDAKIHQPRIELVAGLILIFSSLLVGVTVFLVMQHQTEVHLSKTLQSSAQYRVRLIQDEIKAGLDKTKAVAALPLVIELIHALNDGVDESAARLTLDMAADNLLSTGLTAVALSDKDGREWVRVGSFAERSELTVPLNLPGSVQLMWDGTLFLNVLLDLKSDGRIIGKVKAQTPLPATMGSFKTASSLGLTGDQFVCAPDGLNMQCFPTTLYSQVMTWPRRSSEGVPLPMTYALEGSTGFVTIKDYRNQDVIAAYAPLGNLGLGLVLKIDEAELYAPSRMQLRYLIPILIGGLAFALLMLRWLLNPLVARLVSSEAAATQRALALTQEIAANMQTRTDLLHFKHILDNTLDMIFMFWPDTLGFIYANQGAVLSTGYSLKEIFEMKWNELVPFLPESKNQDSISSALSKEQPSLRFDGYCRRKDGSDFPAAIFLQMVMRADGSRLFVAIVRDITERKRSEQMNTDFVSVMYQENSQGVTVADSKGTILKVNPAFTKITGYTQEDVIGKNSRMFSSGRHDQAFYEALWNEINTIGHWEGEIWNRRKNGEIYLQSLNITAFTRDDGSVYSYVGLFSDISKTKDAKVEKEALQHANKMKSEFLANMSHELRTPLNAIIGFSEALKEGLLGEMSEQQSKYLGHVFDSGKYLLSLINDILDLSKVEAGKMVLDLEPLDISSLFENSVVIVKEKAEAHHLQLQLEVAPDIGVVQVDARKVKQIVFNLLSNAVKFSNEGGTVNLQVRSVPRGDVGKLAGFRAGRTFPFADSEFPDFLEICVTDCGIGISDAGLEKLFQPFIQVDSGLARKFEGTGLGLVMIKSLAELHGGTLAMESTEGQGTRITVWLPLRSVHEERAPVAAPTASIISPAKEDAAPAPRKKEGGYV